MVYAKPPFAGPHQVLSYVGRYTHRIAISNSRLLAIDDGKVRFRWKDYRHDNRHATMTLAADEFIRRFLIHVLPSGFQRIRYYGFLCNRRRQDKLARCRQLLGMASVVPAAASGTSGDYRDVYEALTGNSLRRCPSCDDGHCSSSRFYRARATASGSAIRHDRQLRHVPALQKPAPPRRVDGDLSPRGLALPLAVVARGANPMLGEDFRPVAWKFRPPPSLTGRSFARRKEWRRLSTPIDQLGAGGLVQFVFASPARPRPV